MIPNSLISPFTDWIKIYIKRKMFNKSATYKSIENDIDKAFNVFDKKLNILLNEMFEDIIWTIKDGETKKFLKSFDKENLYNDVESKFWDFSKNKICNDFINNNIKNNTKLNNLKYDFEIKLISFKNIFDNEKYNYKEWTVKKELLLKEKDKVCIAISDNLTKSEELLWEIILNFFDDLKGIINLLPDNEKIVIEMLLINLKNTLKELLKSERNKVYYNKLSKIIWELYDDILNLII